MRLPTFENFGRYFIGVLLLVACFFLEYCVMAGRNPFNGTPFVPSVPAELVGRIIGCWESGTLMFWAWLYQSTKSSQQNAAALAKAAEGRPA